MELQQLLIDLFTQRIDRFAETGESIPFWEAQGLQDFARAAGADWEATLKKTQQVVREALAEGSAGTTTRLS